MFSRLALKPSRRVFSASQITQTSSRSAYYHFRRKWTPHEYDELKEKRELLRAVTDKDAILAKLKERMNDPEKADWPPLTSLTKRVGVVGKKLGHCTYWLRNGKPMPCCMVQASYVHTVVSDLEELPLTFLQLRKYVSYIAAWNFQFARRRQMSSDYYHLHVSIFVPI